jgi:6-phospho-3-hexuloisomerase
MVRLLYKEILGEINLALEALDLETCESFINTILNSNRIVLYGAGRVGFAMKGFAKRLRHLGLESYFLDDVTLPFTGPGDLMIIGSGSGSTPTVKLVAELAKNNGLDLILITAKSISPIAKMSSCTIIINVPSKEDVDKHEASIQPMTTLFEQALCITLDTLVLRMMQILGESKESMKRRHNVIE